LTAEPVTSLSIATPAPVEAPRLSAGQITELLARGDSFLHAGDVASARLFYERAADAGDWQAAIRMGATFDPAFLGRVGVRTVSDPSKAQSWYRHALDLGAPKTGRQVGSPKTN
jgi:TPR repeat protein